MFHEKLEAQRESGLPRSHPAGEGRTQGEIRIHVFFSRLSQVKQSVAKEGLNSK